MTLKELQTWILNHDQPDSWWVAIDGDVQDELTSLADVSKLKDQHPLTKISLLHVSKSEEENAEWETFEKEGPTIFKVTRDNTAGYGNFKKIPRDDPGTNGVEHPVEEIEQELEPEPQEEVAAAPAPAKTQTAAPSGNASDRAKKFFEKRLNKEGSKSNNAAKANVELASNEEFLMLKEEVKELKRELAEMRELMEDLKRPVSEARAMLEEREQFLEMSENSLFEKAQKQEVLQTELAQKSEELDDREKRIVNQEKSLSGKEANV